MLRGTVRLFLCGALGLFSSAAALPQTGATPTADDKTLRELLEEVRLLRRVLQESSVGSLRAQILLTQRQSHDERAVQIDRQLAALRSARTDLSNQVGRMKSQFDEYDRVMATETDPEKRNAYERQMRVMAVERDQLEKSQEQSIEREQDLQTQLSREQAAVDAIQKELDRIESDLAAIQKSQAKQDNPQ